VLCVLWRQERERGDKGQERERGDKGVDDGVQAAQREHEQGKAKLEADVARAKLQLVELEEDKERLRRQFIEFSDTKDLIAASEGLEKRITQLETELNAEVLSLCISMHACICIYICV